MLARRPSRDESSHQSTTGWSELAQVKLVESRSGVRADGRECRRAPLASVRRSPMSDGEADRPILRRSDAELLQGNDRACRKGVPVALSSGSEGGERHLVVPKRRRGVRLDEFYEGANG